MYRIVFVYSWTFPNFVAIPKLVFSFFLFLSDIDVSLTQSDDQSFPTSYASLSVQCPFLNAG